MQDKDFNRIVQAKLSEWQEAGLPDWEAMAEMLDGSADVAFKKKLEAATVPYEAADWSLMAGMMGLPFDKVVGEKLRTAEVPLVAGDWAEMENMFAAQADAPLRAKLAAHSASTAERSRDWKFMAAWLQTAMPVAVSRKWLSRAAVAVLLLLLVWFSINLGKKNIQSAEVIEPATSIQEPKTNPAANLAITTDGEATAAQLGHKASVDSKLFSLEGSGTAKINNAIKAEGTATALINKKTELSISEKAHISINKNIILNEAFEGENTQGKVVTPKVSQKYQLTTLELKASSQPIAVSSPEVRIGLKESPQKPTTSVKLGYTTALFSNTTRFNDPGKMGYATGVRVELDFGSKLSLVTGIAYADRRYVREIFNTTPPDALGNSASRAGLSPFWTSKIKAHYQMIEIPVLLRLKLKEGKKFGLYLQAGLNTMISLKESYLDYDPRSVRNISATIADPGSALQLDKLKPSTHQRSINTYAGNLQFAPGMTYNIGKHWQIQLEPFLQLGLQPTGLKQVRMHSTGVLAAWMYRF